MEHRGNSNNRKVGTDARGTVDEKLTGFGVSRIGRNMGEGLLGRSEALNPGKEEMGHWCLES